MKILLVTATYTPSTNGVAVSVETIKKLLEKKGHEVWVLAPNNRRSEGNEEHVIRYPSIENPKFKDYPIPLFPGIKAIYKLIELKHFDLIHVQHPFHVGYFARLIAQRYKIPLIFTFHTQYDMYADKYFEILSKKIKEIFVTNRVYDFCKKADFIISPSEFIKKKILQKLPFMPTEILPSSVYGLQKEKLPKAEIRRRLGLPVNKKIILTVSRLSAEKDIHLLIEAFKYLPKNMVLLIVGSGPEEENLKNLAGKLKLKEQIIFVGNIKHADIGSYYQHADYFIYASKTETQGLILLEALTFGLPIVAVESGATIEWVNEKYGRLAKDDPEDIAGNLILLEKENYEMLRSAALAKAEDTSPEKISRKLIGIYKKVISAKKLSDKLLTTGWQSWSPSKNRIVKLPMWNYKPNKDFYLPDKHENMTPKKPVSGWCSWYAFGKKIDQEKILSQVSWFKDHREIPIDYILVDGGWTKRGDWKMWDRKKFPDGIQSLSEKIKRAGFKPGIWISPFLVEKNSLFFKERSDLLVNVAGVLIDGLRVFPLFNLIYPNYILDIRKKEGRELVKSNIDYLLTDMGFDLIKLDFLYSIFYIPGITEKEAGFYLSEILTYIKDKFPDVYTIACGTPLSPVIGKVDSVRIGPDVIDMSTSNLPFVNKIINSFKLKRVGKSVEDRFWTRKYWNLDPDVFVCRESLGFDDKQITSLIAIIRKARGNIFLGDDFTKLPKERIKRFV